MPYKRIKWIAVLVPALVLGIWEWIRHEALDPLLPAGLGNLVSAMLVAAGAYLFVRALVRTIEKTAREAADAWRQTEVLRERQRLAREMHDGVAQALFYLHVKLADLEQVAGTEPPDRVRSRLADLRERLNATHREVRQAISDLRRAEENEPFHIALRHQVQQMAEQSGMDLRLQIEGEGNVGIIARSHLLAILQEALLNAHRHGGADRAEIRCRFAAGGGLYLTLQDNGRGFDPGAVPADSYGLMIMQERATLAGGRVEIEAAPGRGARVAVVIEGERHGTGSGPAG